MAKNVNISTITPTYSSVYRKIFRDLIKKGALGDTIVCDELVKAIEGVTTNGKTKLQQG